MCCPQNGIGVTVNCNSNCNRWCPRVLRVFCCCFGCTGDREATDSEEKVSEVASSTLEKAVKTKCDHKVKDNLQKNAKHKTSK